MYEESTPPRNEQLIRIYGLLCSLVTSLPPTIISSSLRDGSGERLNGYIHELISITGDNRLNDFAVQMHSINGRNHVTGESYARQLSGLVNYLHRADKTIGYYCAGPPSLNSSKLDATVPTINNQLSAAQQVSQNTEIQIEINQAIVNLTEKLTNVEHEFPDETSKENKFAKALKKALPTVKSSLDIVTLVLKIASEIGLSPQIALKLLGLS